MMGPAKSLLREHERFVRRQGCEHSVTEGRVEEADSQQVSGFSPEPKVCFSRREGRVAAIRS